MVILLCCWLTYEISLRYEFWPVQVYDWLVETWDRIVVGYSRITPFVWKELGRLMISRGSSLKFHI